MAGTLTPARLSNFCFRTTRPRRATRGDFPFRKVAAMRNSSANEPKGQWTPRRSGHSANSFVTEPRNALSCKSLAPSHREKRGTSNKRKRIIVIIAHNSPATLYRGICSIARASLPLSSSCVFYDVCCNHRRELYNCKTCTINPCHYLD